MCPCVSGVSSSHPPPFAAQFRVLGPDQPVTAVVGEDVVLPCRLSPRLNAENMDVLWFWSKSRIFVHIYSNGQDDYSSQMPQYRGRTELSKEGLSVGNVSLRILSTRLSDEGQYQCLVQDGDSYEEASVELQVAGKRQESGLSTRRAPGMSHLPTPTHKSPLVSLCWAAQLLASISPPAWPQIPAQQGLAHGQSPHTSPGEQHQPPEKQTRLGCAQSESPCGSGFMWGRRQRGRNATNSRPSSEVSVSLSPGLP